MNSRIRKFVKAKARKLYNGIDEVWPESNQWSRHTYYFIRRELTRLFVNDNIASGLILNAGSSGNDYRIQAHPQIHVDFCLNGLPPGNSVIADLEALPFRSSVFENVICVGAVINYCDPVSAINEISRVICEKGCFILDFESSRSFELLGSKDFDSAATLTRSAYNGCNDILWLYSPEFIMKLLKSMDFRVNKILYYHTISSASYRITGREPGKRIIFMADRLISRIPGIRRYSSNILIISKKLSK